MNEDNMVTTLRDETRRMLKHRPTTLKLATIAKEMNVSIGWLGKFLRGETAHPSVVYIETLHAVLLNYTANTHK